MSRKGPRLAPTAHSVDAIGPEPMPLWLELVLLAIHVRLVIAWNFQSIDALDAVADWAIPMIGIPWIVVMSGRSGAFFMALPITLLPIAGKTVRQLAYGEGRVSIPTGFDLYLAFPLLVSIVLAVLLARASWHRAHHRWLPPSA